MKGSLIAVTGACQFTSMSRALLKQKTTHVPASLKPFASLNELEARALPNLTDATYGYYASGAEEERTLRDNEAAFARWRLLPRVLVDVSRVDTSCTLLGEAEGWERRQLRHVCMCYTPQSSSCFSGHT